MADDFIPLRCPQCGAALQVYGDMERFACSYCHTETVVQRRGGTVMLRAVVDVIAKVQSGTDRTAAELALPRLEAELLNTRRRIIPTFKPDTVGYWIGLIVCGAISAALVVSALSGSGFSLCSLQSHLRGAHGFRWTKLDTVKNGMRRESSGWQR
jgi:hypothetical protein